MTKNGSFIDDFVWISRAYPKFHDILVLIFSFQELGQIRPKFFPENSPQSRTFNYKLDPDNDFAHKNDSRTGYYFCADELPIKGVVV